MFYFYLLYNSKTTNFLCCLFLIGIFNFHEKLGVCFSKLNKIFHLFWLTSLTIRSSQLGCFGGHLEVWMSVRLWWQQAGPREHRVWSHQSGVVLSGVSAQNGLHHLRWRPRQQVHQGWKYRGLEIPLKLWGAPCFCGMYGCQSTPHRTFHLVVSGLELSIRSLSFMQSHNPHDLLIVLNTVMYWSMFSPDSWFRLLNLKRSKNYLLSQRKCEPSFSRMTLHFLLSVSLENLPL